MIPKYKDGEKRLYKFCFEEVDKFFDEIRKNREYHSKTDKEISEIFRFNLFFNFDLNFL